MTALGINNPNSKWMREYNGRNGGLNIEAAPLPAEAKQRNAFILEMAMANMKAEKLAAAMPCADLMIDGFNLIADMTPEMEQALNDLIERGEK